MTEFTIWSFLLVVSVWRAIWLDNNAYYTILLPQARCCKRTIFVDCSVKRWKAGILGVITFLSALFTVCIYGSSNNGYGKSKRKETKHNKRDSNSYSVFLSQRHKDGRLCCGATQEAMANFCVSGETIRQIWRLGTEGVIVTINKRFVAIAR